MERLSRNPYPDERECVSILRLGLNGEKLQYDGDHYQLQGGGEENRYVISTSRPNLPIYLATLGRSHTNDRRTSRWLVGDLFPSGEGQHLSSPI